MQLSEAIRLGSMLKPQGFGTFLIEGGTCALGAAADSVGALDAIIHSDDDSLGARWPILEVITACPACRRRSTLGVTITTLNDWHRWTREEIADWVQTVESARQQADEQAGTTNAVASSVDEPEAVTSRI